MTKLKMLIQDLVQEGEKKKKTDNTVYLYPHPGA
jgi:hypothetical protein